MEEKRPAPWPRPFASALTRREAVLVLTYLPLHLFVLRYVFNRLFESGAIDPAGANVIYYSLGFVWMLFAAFGFLRRDFDALLDAPLRCLREVLGGYGLMLLCNLAVGLLLLYLLPALGGNPNNQAVAAAARAAEAGGSAAGVSVSASGSRAMEAVIIFFGPVVEEMLFRAGIFGLLRHRNRRAAYLVSALCFALTHVAPYAAADPGSWVYLVQYIPAALLLARCYERSNCIWCSVFFHMLNNGVALRALSLLM